MLRFVNRAAGRKPQVRMIKGGGLFRESGFAFWGKQGQPPGSEPSKVSFFQIAADLAQPASIVFALKL